MEINIFTWRLQNHLLFHQQEYQQQRSKLWEYLII
jgi:hypothetical protein